MDIRELYQEVIMDHNRNPRNHHDMPNASCQACGYNPLCGDQLTVYVHIAGGIVDDLSFVGCGCAISQASASLMSEALKGKTVAEAESIYQHFHLMLTDDVDNPLPDLGKLTVLAGVREFPMRVKCATLAWHTLDAALKKDNTLVSTE
jgi:nitrogen fixation NifU-like protein